MKTILVTGIGGLTPRSITTVIRKNHPDYRIIGCDIDKKAMGFFMKGLVDQYYVCPRCTSQEYFPWIENLVNKEKIDYAFQYSWDFDDYHLLVSENKIENNETLTGVLSSSVPNDKKIISQERSFINRIEKLNEEMKIINVSSRLTFDTNKPKNIVIIIESNKTDKEWYNEQYRLAELFNTQITIIHLL